MLLLWPFFLLLITKRITKTIAITNRAPIPATTPAIIDVELLLFVDFFPLSILSLGFPFESIGLVPVGSTLF